MAIREIKWYEDPVYIKMCYKATEVQKLFTAEYGDVSYNLVTNKAVMVLDHSESMRTWNCYGHKGRRIKNKRLRVWLPTQQQLQKIWGERLPESLPWFYVFAVDDVPGRFTSMEQLWLAFVMKETYHKVWNDEDWI